jgi:hypothetical protein
MMKKKLDLKLSEIGPKVDELHYSTASPGVGCGPCTEMGDLMDYMAGYDNGYHSETFIYGTVDLEVTGKPVISGSCFLGIITDIGDAVTGD